MSGVTVDPKSMKGLLKRFDKAPARMQSNAMRAVGRAGANVVKNAAKTLAPSYLKKNIKTVARKSHGKKLFSKFSVTVSSNRGIDDLTETKAQVKKFDPTAKFSTHYPPIWVEFGTYGKRDYKGTEPYSPDTLKKKSYASGRSNSPYWDDKYKGTKLWIDPKPFMRPAINDNVKAVEEAMVKKLDAYLTKKGL